MTILRERFLVLQNWVRQGAKEIKINFNIWIIQGVVHGATIFFTTSLLAKFEPMFGFHILNLGAVYFEADADPKG